LDYNHTELGVVQPTVTFVNASINLVLPVYASTIYFIPVNVLTGQTSGIVFGFISGGNNPGALLNPNPESNNMDQASIIVFNGSLWDTPGSEKTIYRLEVFYKNVGQCTLILVLKAWQQQTQSYDTKTDTITIGDVSADLSERSAYFDIEATGEIVEATLVRNSNAGPMCLLAFSPSIQDRGEKVEAV
jgi:hypothetical protein